MAISITHPFVSAIADDPAAVAAGQAVPSNWNANHTITMATANLLGRTTAGTGTVEELPAATARSFLGLVIGTNVQAFSTNLTTWSGITPGTGVSTFLATPTSANLASAVTDETGTGALVFANSPTLVTPTLGAATATSLTLTNDLTVANGGTGLSTMTANAVVIGAGASSPTFVSPGTSGNVLTSNGTTWSSQAPAVTALPTLIVRDQKATTTNPNSAVATTWSARDLNTIDLNTISGASVSSNQIILPAGTYLIEGSTSSFQCGTAKTRLYNVTDGTSVLVGTSEYSAPSTGPTVRSFIRGTFTIAAQKTFKIETYSSSSGLLGTPGGASVVEVYSEIMIQKVS